MTVLGLLNINKPPGWTSRDVVNRVERLVRPAKAGHAGTLDPLATGVLVVCVGSATRLIEYVQGGRKKYRATFLLGRESDTEDVSGNVMLFADAPIPKREAIVAALPGFVGALLQRPPAYSALKVQGKRAYALARQGKAVELAPRPIEIFALSLVGYAYPELVLDVECSSGTYVRSLGRDIALALGTRALMSGLVRTAVGPFTIGAAIDLAELTAADTSAHLQPMTLAVSHLPSITLIAEQVTHATQGKRLTLAESFAADEIAALDASGRLVAILSRAGDHWRPAKVFPLA